jgi:hypothetical protein
MGSGLLLQKARKVRKYKQGTIKVPRLIKLVSAQYLGGYRVQCTFGDGHVSVIDFEKALHKYAKGYYAKYLKPSNFRKFKIDSNNLVWGANWDLIFPLHELYIGKV